MLARDTSREAQDAQLSVFRRMSGEQRLRLALDMSDSVRAMSLSRIRSEHPEWTEWEVKRELLRLDFLPRVSSLWIPVSAADSLRSFVEALDQAGVPYMLTGSYARSGFATLGSGRSGVRRCASPGLGRRRCSSREFPHGRGGLIINDYSGYLPHVINPAGIVYELAIWGFPPLSLDLTSRSIYRPAHTMSS